LALIYKKGGVIPPFSSTQINFMPACIFDKSKPAKNRNSKK